MPRGRPPVFLSIDGMESSVRGGKLLMDKARVTQFRALRIDPWLVLMGSRKCDKLALDAISALSGDRKADFITVNKALKPIGN